MPSLVALDLPAGPGWVAVMREAWDRGDAVFPVDPRLPEPARAKLIASLAPSSIVTPAGSVATEGRPVEPDDALVVATSGSSGDPRGVVLTHTAIRAAAEATSSRLQVDPSRDRWLACLPLSHMGGLGVVMRALYTGTPLDVHDGFDPSQVAAAVSNGANLTSLVAALVPRIDISSFRRVLVGGGPAPSGLPDNVVVTYGMTETGGGVVYDGMPLAGVDVRIDNGEILVKGPMLLRSYRDGSDPRDEAGWLATGDMGTLDAEGRLVVTGRKHDLIISGGENISPEVVEYRLRDHPAVADVAIVGRPDPEWGQIVVALVVPVPAQPPPDLQLLRSFVSEQLPTFMAPRAVEYREHLPRTSLGKLRRGDL